MGGVEKIYAEIKSQADDGSGLTFAGAIAKAQLDTTAGTQPCNADFQIRSPEYSSLHCYPIILKYWPKDGELTRSANLR
jgi:hypothetical protein